MSQLHWREGAASSQDYRGSVGTCHLLLDQRPLWLQHLAEVELLLPTWLLVRLNQLDLFFLFIFFSTTLSHCSPFQEDECLRWISQTVKSFIVFRIFQAHSDCRSCGLCHHLGSLPGCAIRDTVLTAWTPVLALQWMDCWITSYCFKSHYQDTEAVLTKLFIFYHTFLFFYSPIIHFWF